MHRRYYLSALVAGVVVGGMVGTAAAAEKIDFKYAPPVPAVYQETATKRVEMVHGTDSVVDTVETKKKYEIQKSALGYTLKVVPLSTRFSHNGTEQPDPLAGVNALPLTYDLNAGGKLVTVSGYEALGDVLKKSFPEETAAQLAQVINQDTLVNRDKVEWAARITDFSGKTFTLGETVIGSADYKLPTGGAARYFIANTVTEQTACGNGQGGCVKITFLYNSNAKDLKDYLGAYLDKTGQFDDAAGTAVPATTVRITGKGERVMDPGTMRIYSEKTEREIQFETEVPGQGKIPTVQREKQEYVFEY